MLGKYAKAITAFITGFAVPFAGALTATSDSGGTVTSGEWITAAVAGIVAGFAVAAVPNKPAPAPADGGYGLVELVVVVLLILILVFVLLRVMG